MPECGSSQFEQAGRSAGLTSEPTRARKPLSRTSRISRTSRLRSGSLDRGRHAAQFGEHVILDAGAVLLAGVEAVARADELDAGGAMVSALLEAQRDQRARKRR